MRKNILAAIAASLFAGSLAFAATYPSLGTMEQEIRRQAPRHGINPDIATRVARSEGLNAAAARMNFRVPEAVGGYSYGPFQLYSRGLAVSFAHRFGQPSGANWRQQIAYSLDYASKYGWYAWHGAARVGVGAWTGIHRHPGGWLHVHVKKRRHGFPPRRYWVHHHRSGWAHIHR